MSRKRLFEDFAFMSKSDWLKRVEQDPRAAALIKKLTWQAGDISIPAYATADDLADAGSQATVRWDYPNTWQIAEPLDQTDTPAAYKRALESGADALWIESATAMVNFSPGNLPAHGFHFFGKGFNGQHGVDLLDLLPYAPGSISILTEASTGVSPALLRQLAETSACRFVVIRLAGRPPDKSSSTRDLTDALHAFHQFATRFKALELPLSILLNAVQFVFPLGTSFYLEMGRMRAMRLLLSKLVLELDPDFQEAIAIPFIADTSFDRDAPDDDPHNNILRGTTMGLSAILAGCSLLIIRPFSDTDFARRVARNTQLILKHESHVHEAEDPGAGSWYIDHMTHQLANAAWEHFTSELANRG